MRTLFAYLAAAFLIHFAVSGAPIEGCIYGSPDAARNAWQPMFGSAPVETTNRDGRAALRMPCVFQSREAERASWDRKVNLDLGMASGIKLSIWCDNPAPVSHFSLYFKSGPGWYHASFYPELPGQWNEIVIDKTSTQMEGTPLGWSKIDEIRISAWCASKNNTEFLLGGISEVGKLGVDSAVAVLRADSAAAQESASVAEAAERTSLYLRRLGIPCAVLSDLDATPERLAAAKMVVLPHNPSMPDPVAELLLAYLQQGGKLMAFYIVPPKLSQAIGISGGRHIKAPAPGAFASLHFEQGSIPGAPAVVEQQSWNINAYDALPGKSRVVARWQDTAGKTSSYPAIIISSNSVVMTHVLLAGDSGRKERMLLALTGHLIPEVWREASQAALDKMGEIGSYHNFDAASKGILAASSTPQVKKSINDARAAHESARRLIKAGEHSQAIDQARLAAKYLEEALCLAQKSEPGEFRAFWCHSAFGVQGIDWGEAVKRLAQNGFTAVFPNMLWGGVAFYPSDTLPTASTVEVRGDQIAECLKAAAKYGLQVHVWKVNFNLGSAAPREFLERMRKERRLQMSLDGKEEPWLCPSHPENQALEIASMVEVARQYPVHGIHFDYIRYPDSSHCFCPGCHDRFAASRSELKQWPKDVLPGGALRTEWLDWRRSNITTVVRETSRQAREVRKGIKLSAAVFRNWTTDRDIVGQDWKTWCDQGYLDFVCPMDYTDNNRVFENMVRQQVEWSGRVPCYPGIGVSASSSSFGVDKVIDQILITRRFGTRGFIIFNYGVPESATLTPQLGMGITKKR